METKRKYNLTTGFALPLLGWKKSMYQPNLINAYIRHEEVDRFREDHLFLLFKWSDDDHFKKICDILSESQLYASQYNPDRDGNLVMYVMRIPRKLVPDYRLFLDGKYSQVSHRAQELIKMNNKPGGKIARILNRDDHYREDMETKVGEVLPKDAEVYTSIQDENLLRKQVFTSSQVVEFIN